MKTVNEGDFDYKEKCRTGMRDREEGAHILQEVHEAIDTMVQVREFILIVGEIIEND